VRKLEVSGDFLRLYGTALGECLNAQPLSSFLAEGSSVSIMQKSKI
jgi:hypothetical protein